MPARIKAPRPKAQRWRTAVQIFFFVLVVLIATTTALKEKGVVLPLAGSASLHAICPFGGVVSFWQLATLGTLVKKVHESSVVLAVLGLLLALLFGPVICGWVCPFGSFQEWLGKLGKKLFGKKYNAMLPRGLDRILRFLRYAVLVWVSYMTVVTGKLFFQDYDPYFALFNFWTGEVAVAGFIALGATILLSLAVERPFCKYACPYGALLGIFNLFRIFGIKRKASTCISCHACTKACPMNIEVESRTVVRDHQCLSCLKCTSEAACPVPATVELAFGPLEVPAEGTARAMAPNGAASEGGRS